MFLKRIFSLPWTLCSLTMRGASVLVSVLFVSYLLWTGWVQFGPTKTDPDAVRARAAVQATAEIVDRLREHRQEIKSLTFLNFAGDPTDLVADNLRATMAAAGTFLVADRTLWDKVRKQVSVSQHATDDLQQALQMGRANGSDGVLYGRVEQFEAVKGCGILKIDYALADSKTGEVIYHGRYDTTTTTAAPLDISILLPPISKPGLLRFCGWVLMVFLLPIFTINFLMLMTEKRSNAVNAFVLATYTLVDAILAWILLAPTWASHASIALFVVLCTAAFFYNVQIMTLAVKRNDGI